jgi:hypothetical protein
MLNQNVKHPENFIFLSLVKDNQVIQTFDIQIDNLIYYQDYIESAFQNNTGGWTIRISISI